MYMYITQSSNLLMAIDLRVATSMADREAGQGYTGRRDLDFSKVRSRDYLSVHYSI